MYKLCVFDMDGTVVNSIGDIAAAMNRSLKKLGYAQYEEKEYCKMVGNGMENLCRRAMSGREESEIQKLISIYKEDYINNCCDKSCVYDGVDDVIRKLNKKGVKCAILSNKPHEQAMEIADTLFEEGMFCKILGQTPDFPIKPSPVSLQWVMKECGVDKSEVAYIGDSDVDIRLGKAAEVFTVGVAWGFRGAEELKNEGADAVVENAAELAAVLGV